MAGHPVVVLLAVVRVVRMTRMASTDDDDDSSNNNNSSSSRNNNNNNNNSSSSGKALLLVERMNGTIQPDFLLSERQSIIRCVVAILHMRMLRCQEKKKKLHRRRNPALCSFDLIPTEPRVWLCGRPTLLWGFSSIDRWPVVHAISTLILGPA